ncbi:hypothetical protein F511_38319 [Dorcoceras hygrometricum]|uniref:Uncharacterized protein n=1 Tax=Dorcoceras hygrometricum TaxID=472368 RepID=A0A2Z7AFM5_9LAMI|nr:hypothetical protein F511_38319 [Dorcoceras hygrometricum]
MRSVIVSHGPGSNPMGNAICNAILLQSFPVLQIFGLQYLDRHCPPSSDVLPLNLTAVDIGNPVHDQNRESFVSLHYNALTNSARRILLEKLGRNDFRRRGGGGGRRTTAA